MDEPRPLPRSFFERQTLRVAKELLGKYVVRETDGERLSARIVDVEAYVGFNDRASHASRGRTKRTDIMFGLSGLAYVYLIYGMYHCLNLVTEAVDYPAAVLIRGIEVCQKEREPTGAPVRIEGPGRTCRFLAVDRTLNGLDTTLGQDLWIEDRGEAMAPSYIQALPRVGVDYAGDWAKKPWRFCIERHSKKRSRRRNISSSPHKNHPSS